MKRLSKNRILSLFLALTILFTALPFNTVGANASVSNSINSNYGSVIGNTAEFNGYFPVPVSTDPEKVKNPWGTDCEQFSDSETPDNLVLVITNYHCSDSGELWYKVKATPGQELPGKLQTNPWVYQDNINNPLGDSLIIHDNGKNYVFDEDGNIASSITFTDFNSKKLLAQSTLQGSVKYQWQIEYETGKWINIYKENEAEIDISISMIATLLVDDSVNVRCVSSCTFKSAISDTIKISVDFNSFGTNHENTVENSIPEESKRMVYAAPVMYAANDGIDTVAEESNTVLVTVQFVMGNNTAPIENGLFTYNVPYNGNVKDNIVIPAVQGYTAYLEDDRNTPIIGTYGLNETNVTENKTITFRFWPAEVSYKVVYMQQNVLDDGYTVVRTDNLTGLTGSDPIVENVIQDGFIQVWCDTDKIAADGSTVIEVKYDRLYFKMLFDLDGGYGVQPVYARYGTPVSVINPTKAGYIFLGWNALNGPYNESDGEKTVDIGAFTDITIPAMHTNYKALWQASETAKVTVVIWGQNADDNNYSYMADASNGLSFQAKPDTEVTYNPNGGYVCGYAEEHVHGEGDCESTCGKTEHTHSAVGGSCYTLTCNDIVHTAHTDSCYTCGIINHNHTTACYSGVGNKQDVYTGIPNNPSEGYVCDHWYYDNLIYIDGSWYKYSGTTSAGTIASTTCGKTEGTHTHSDACISTDSSCPGIHTHTANCYMLSCTSEEHSHNATCYAGCIKEEHTHGEGCMLTISGMSSNLWTFSHADAVTVAADGSTTLNVYYNRTEFTLHFRDQNSDSDDFGTITDRWGSNIEKRFYEACEKAGYNSWSEKRNASSPWTNHLEIMPAENRTYYRYEGSGNMIFIMTYYKETFVEGEYEKAFEVELHRGNYTTVSEEEYIELEGFEINKSKSTDIGERTDGAVFYYDRKSFHLVFDNYNTIEKNEPVLFETPLSTYGSYTLDASQAPAVYQPGSVTFKGWYLAPQTPNDFNFNNVNAFDFANSTMPANDLKLYAWWQPVTHNVTFYYDYAALEAGTVYVADNITYNYDVPHGSPIQNPYTPPVDPTSSYYSFVGWFYVNENGTETMWDFTYTTVTGDVQLYGKWNSTTPADYEVKFVYVDKNGKEISIADPIIGRALGGTTKTFDAKFNEELYEGYQDRYYPRDMSHSITINLEDVSQNTFTFYYDYVEYTSYTVKYLEKETGKPMSEISAEYPSKKTVENNTHAMVTETFVAIPGYLPDAYQKVCKIDPDGTNEIVFFYTKDNENGLWTVHYWLENLEGTYSEAIDMLFTGTAKNGAIVTAPTDTVIENYTYYAAHPNNVSTGTVSINEVTHLHMYYKRTLHNYKVQYLEAGTNKVIAPEKVVEDLKWETLVTEYAIDANINFDIYKVYGDAEKSLEISVDETKNVITFYYTEKRVNINYRVVGPDGCGTVTPGSESLQISSGIASGSVASPSSSVYKFVGWYSDSECMNSLGTNTTYVPTKSENALWVDGTTYYAKFKYNLTSLTIEKQGHDSIDVNQTFIFTIRGVPETDTAGIDLTVTIHGNGEITITDLPIGNYVVTEQTDWSWRYDLTEWSFTTDGDNNKNVSTDGVNGATITLGATGNDITFTNERTKIYWLDGDSYKVNIFRKKEDKEGGNVNV